MAAEVQCPYHHASWRSRTQHVLNGLRGRLLTRSQAKKFSSYVCVCPGRPSVASRETLDAAPELATWLESKPSSLPGEVRSSLQRYLAAAADLRPAELGLGLVHMVAVVHKAALGKLEDESGSGPSSPPLKPCYKEEKWGLSLPAVYVGLLIGCDGQHIKQLCEEHKTSIYFGTKQSLNDGRTRRLHHYQARYSQSVTVTVVTREDQSVDIDKLKRQLEAKAEDLKAKRKVHEEAMEKFRERKLKRLEHQKMRHDPSKYVNTGIHRDSKEAAIDHYHRKHQQKTKTRHAPRSQPHSVISEGHCLNCLTPYSPNLTHTGACTFHSGFLTAVKAGKNRGYKWTCCGRRTAKHRPIPNQHSRTGCSSGRHRWRPGKGCVRKNKDSWLSNDIILI